MTTSDLQATIEKLRKEKYPELNSSLIAKIIEIQTDSLERPSEANKKLSAVIEKFLQTGGDVA